MTAVCDHQPHRSSATEVILYFAPVGKGGLSDYAIQQVKAIDDSGVSVVVVGESHLEEPLAKSCPNVEFLCLHESFARLRQWGRPGRALSSMFNAVNRVRQLSNLIEERGIHRVIFAAFAEYWSPFWVWRLRSLQKKGVRFGVVIHDPIRDFQVGPRWWHRWSVSLAYSFVDVGFVHDSTLPDTCGLKNPLSVLEIPHGLYEFPIPTPLPIQQEVRLELGIPQESVVLLSFGHIRDGKNLDLVIRALVDFPECHLLVAGREQSTAQRPAKYYQDLAVRAGVADRCHWFTGFIPDDDVWKYFVACDAVALTYSRQFRSASGVLNVAVPFGKPVIASAGDGPLKQIFAKYRLGFWCEPDSLDDFQKCLRQFLSHRFADAEWKRYQSDHSWTRNAQTVLLGMRVGSQ